MTHATDDSAISMVLEQIIENGFDGLDTAVSILINEAMRIERSRVLEAEPWQRTQSRKGYANGYKPKSVDSRVGKLALKVPRFAVRFSFIPTLLKRDFAASGRLRWPWPRCTSTGSPPVK